MRHINFRTLRTLLGIFAVSWALAVPATAEAAPPVRPPAHVQVVLDTSGSMNKSDLDRLSVLAAMLFVDLGDPNDSLGILGMRSSRGSYVLHPLERIGEGSDRIKESFRDVSFVGGTDCAGPLETAAQALAARKTAQPSAQQFVIFLSDGECTLDKERYPLDEATRKLASQGVRVYTIGLFPDDADYKGDPKADLSRIASDTDAEFFQVNQAGDIPARFADILGVILGSQAQPITIGKDGAATLQVDDHLVDASLVLTSEGTAATVSRVETADDSIYNLPTPRPSIVHDERELRAVADRNSKAQFYQVVRLEKPTKGAWKLTIANPEGARALLIQNYALDPVLELPDKQEKYKIGEAIEPVVYLRSPDGNRIADPSFLDKVSFTLDFQSPSKKRGTLPLERQPDGSYTGTLKLEEDGAYALSARAAMKAGGLDKRTDEIEVEAMALDLIVAAGQGPIDFGTVKAGESSASQTVDLSASKVGSTYDLTLELAMRGDGDIENVPGEAPISADNQLVEVAFEVDTDHPGGEVEGTLEIRYNESMVKVPVRGEVIPLTFWERFGKLVMALASGLLGLALLLFIIIGFVRPHDFPPAMRVKFSDSMSKLQDRKAMPIEQIQGTKSGFYRNAHLHFGGTQPPFLVSIGKHPLATLEAVGPARVELQAGKGVQLRRVNEFAPERENDEVIEGDSCSFRMGEIYRINEYVIERC